MHIKASMVVSAAMLIVGVADPASACRGIQMSSPASLVERAALIVHVRAEAELPTSVLTDNQAGLNRSVRFTVLRTVKGSTSLTEMVFNGRLEDRDDFNDHQVPYSFVRRGGRGGNCFALGYRKGAEYLLLLNRPANQPEGTWTPYWATLTPTNEQVRGNTDPWLRWVVQQIK